MSELTITFDGKSVQVPGGLTVLEAARKAGVDIPTLCAHDELAPFGACRLCVVKIDGMRGFPPSCTTPAADGMKIETMSPEIFKLRKNVLALTMSGHTSPCIVCLHKDLCEEFRPNPTKSGRTTRCQTCSQRSDCILRELCATYEVKDFDFPIIYNNIPLERTDPFMDRDYSLCVLCGKCVRICAEVNDQPAIAFIGRGKDTRIGTVAHRNHTETNCSFCGTCIDICPTGALTDRFTKWRGYQDRVEPTTCLLCPMGCDINVKIKNDKVIGAQARALTKEARVCTIGRFVLPQLFEHPSRLTCHRIRSDGLERKATYEEVLNHAVSVLKPFSGPGFAFIAHPAASREDLHVMRKFTGAVMGSDNFAIAHPSGAGAVVTPETLIREIETGAVKAVLTTGDYLEPALLEKLEALVVVDTFTSKRLKSADAVIGASFLAETDGTFYNAFGELRRYQAKAKAPADVHPDWKIIGDLATLMGAEGFDFPSFDSITERLSTAEQDRDGVTVSPLDDLSVLPQTYRGHALADVVCALSNILPRKPAAGDKPAGVDEPPATAGQKVFEIVEKKELVPDTHMVVVHAPDIARHCQPGQFVIVMVNEHSERIPYTIADWDSDAGTVTMNVLEAGRSSREMALLQPGDCLAHFTGPLGKPVEVKNYGTILCGGGCYGVGAMLPIIRAMKEAGNKVICVNEASSHYLLYWDDLLAGHSDDYLVVTKDGSKGMKGGVQEVIASLVERGERIDQSFIIGCTFMMMLVAEETKKHEIPTLTAMNPLMLDGTGMCGACRVTMGDKTRFACVDGPFLDAHQIDWPTLLSRNSAFGREEVEALPQDHSHLCRSM